MVVIFSSSGDLSSLEVKKWLDFFGEESLLITPSSLAQKLSLFYDTQKQTLEIDGQRLSMDRVKSLWFRKWPTSKEPKLKFTSNKEENLEIGRWMKEELDQISMFLFSLFKQEKWLCYPNSTKTNKLIQQQMAIAIGLDTPKTFVTTNWQVSSGIRFITKAIESNIRISLGRNLYTNYTVDCNPFSNAFPSMVQEKIDKEYEVRTFFLKGRCYSMAIFSQNDEQTKSDFRRYNINNPNRTVPYQLDIKYEKRINMLMQNLNLNTGSLDFVKCKKSKKLYFLEVNPQGQFGMVSKPCNYHLEKHIANALRSTNYGGN